MEHWVALIDVCPSPVDLKFFNKAVQTAGVVLKQDLAPFETEWVLHTLLHQPVNLLETVHTQHTDHQWSKAIGDAFKLLATICTTWKDACEPHFEDIMSLTELPLEPLVFRHALSCVESVARVSAVAARGAAVLLARLEHATACRASLATAVGVICEYHPEAVQDSYNTIWRVYLNMLDSDKTNVPSVLQGILGLFTHFGCELPTAELRPFYERLATDCLYTPRCKQVCQKILISHANIFRENIAADERLRTFLWEELEATTGSAELAVQAVTAVYAAVIVCLDKVRLKNIAIKEVLPKTSHPRIQTKYTALRILSRIESYTKIDSGAKQCFDVQGLEFELRDESVSYDVAEAVSYCIEANLENSDDLLQSAMMFYRHLPANRRKQIVVHGLLIAPADVRTAATIFLTSESTAEDTSLEDHLPFWRDLFDSEGGRDATVAERAPAVFEEFVNHAIFALNSFLEDGTEIIPPKLNRLLELTSHILSFQPRAYTSDLCPVLFSSLIEVARCHIDAVLVKTMRWTIMHLEKDSYIEMVKKVCQMVRLESCDDEALVCEMCLLCLQSPAEALPTEDLLLALLIIFSRGDVESAVLSGALKKLESLIVTEYDRLDKSILRTIIHRVDGTRFRKTLKGKDDRILNRDIILIIGKYGRETDATSEDSSSDVDLIKLIDSFVLTLPDLDEGVNYKLPLSRIADVALRREDPETLQKLLPIICAQLASRPDASLQSILPRVCHALCAAHVRGSSCDTRTIHAALLYCASPQLIATHIQYITEEISPGVRRMLADGLEAILLQDGDDALVPFVCEHAAVLLRSGISTKKRAGLNITEALLAALKQNNELSKENLLNILILIVKTNLTRAESVFQHGVEILMEKIELFDDNVIKNTINELLEDLVENQDINGLKTDEDIRTFENKTNIIIDFLKRVFEYKDWSENDLLLKIFEVISNRNHNKTKGIYILSTLKEKYQLTTEICRQLLTNQNCMILKMLFDGKSCMEGDYFRMESDFKFLQQYSEVLLEIRYEETLQYIANLIKNSSPKAVIHERKSIERCLTAYTHRQVPSRLQSAFEDWCMKLPLQIITTSIEKEQFTDEHKTMIAALKILIKFFDMATLTDLAIDARKWAKILLKLYSSGYFAYLKPKMTYLTDLLTVSVRFMTATDVKSMLSEGCYLKELPEQKNGEDFCRFFVNVFFDTLVRKPFVLLEVESSTLINDLVKYSLKRKCNDVQYENIMELVDKIWPNYAAHSTFKQKYSLLLDMTNFPRRLAAESRPLLWAVDVLSGDSSVEDKARIVTVLPGGKTYSAHYRSFASLLAVRLSEMDGKSPACFRALLDSLARTGDLVLMDIVANLAGGDDAAGWWDAAIDSCMVSLAANADLALLRAVFTRVTAGRSRGVRERVLLPLLRYSSSSLCESFYASLLPDLLRLNIKIPASAQRYRDFVLDHTTAFKVLELAFQKIPTPNIESSTSPLYKEVAPVQNWHLVRETCRLCLSLTQHLALPAGADDTLKEDFRLLHCAIYNCFSAAITCRRPDEKLYRYIFGTTVWDRLTDESKQYDLRIRPLWNQRTKLQPVSIGVEGAGSDLSSHSLTHTLRSKMFVRTLSENPFVFDFTKDLGEEEIKSSEVRLPLNELNNHECAATLTALLCHVTATQMAEWLAALLGALGEGKRNTRWLLAQIICNCKEELKPHGDSLSASLLEVIAATPVQSEGKAVLNGLHVDILETLMFWNAKLEDRDAINKTIEILLNTLLRHRKHKSVYRTLLTVLSKFLDVFGNMVTEIDFGISEECFSVSVPDTVEVLKHLVKAQVRVQQLVPTLLNQLETPQGSQHYNLAELFGMALDLCDNKTVYLTRFSKLLDKFRNIGIDKYVKVLYYAQRVCALCIDEKNFRMTMDITRKLVGPDKEKCLKILTTYLARSPTSDYVQEVFEALDLPELILADDEAAFYLIKAGVKAMDVSAKRLLVKLVAGCCSHSVVKVRKAASEVVVAAFKDLLKTSETPQFKKPKTTSTQMILCILSDDEYVCSVVRAAAVCCLDKDSAISSMARKEIAKCMSKNFGLRFTEAFLMSVYLPVTTSSTSTAIELSACAAVLLEMLFDDLKSRERFRAHRLSEEPLQTRAPNADTGPPKLLSMASSYQGSLTLSSATLTRRRKNVIRGTAATTPDIDVQITVESILDTFLNFSKSTPEAAETLCIEFLRSIKAGFEFDTCIAQCLASVLERGPNALTAFVVQLCDAFLGDVCEVASIPNVVKSLRTSTKGTDGEDIVKYLQLNIELRHDNEDLTWGVPDTDEDVAMPGPTEFSIEDLTCVFGKLSDWHRLTLREQRTIKHSGLPPLWTDAGTFKTQLESYHNTPSSDWFSRMVSAYKQEGKEYTLKWLRTVDRWPRKHFHVSAVTEAIEWLTESEDYDKYAVCKIHPSDCLAEWAARLMIRGAHNKRIERSSSEEMRARSVELAWCRAANSRGLAGLVLPCVERNVAAERSLFESETLPWLLEKLTARRDIDREKGHAHSTRQLIDVARNCFEQYAEVSHADDVVRLQHLIMLLHQDMNGLTHKLTQDCLKIIDRYISKIPEELRNKDTVASICEVALNYYDKNWSHDPVSSFKEMVSIVSRVRNFDISDMGYLAVLLNRLEDVTGTIADDVAAELLDLIQLYPANEFFLEHIRNHRAVFPRRLYAACPKVCEREGDTVSVHKQYLQLVADAQFGLQQYCGELLRALGDRDAEKWRSTFARMKAKIFENPHAGADYQLLNKHKSKLYEIAEYDPSETFASTARKRLQEICQPQQSPPRVLRLSQLCPALSRSRDCPSALLGLRDNLTVVRFYDQVQVYTDSIRRPVVLKVLVSDGSTRRYLLKSGEPLQADAAAQAVLRYAGLLWAPHTMQVIAYSVIPLSADSGLIEFLEDTERVRDLIKETVDLDALLSSDASYHSARARTPREALRRAVARRSLSAQDLTSKLRVAGHTLATSTIFTWIMGVGDRHLENILYRRQDGGVWHVDWGQLFEWGLREPVPARLTPNLRALTGGRELEANLQRLLAVLRASRHLFIALLKICFKWMGQDFAEKLTHIESLLEGKARSVDVTRLVIEGSTLPGADKLKLVALLDAAFTDYPQKEEYSVEEQIWSFLHQCTAPQLLSACRRPWEPWA